MDTVVVACKIPSGVRLSDEVIAQGPKPIPNGTPFNQRPSRPGGFELTKGVPQEVWNSWFNANKASMMVKKGLIFADVDEAVVRTHCIQHKDISSGLEQTSKTWGM